MKTENMGKMVGLVFLGALAFYVIAYTAVEYWRPRKGPWQVTFISGSNQPPTIRIEQPHLGITNVSIVFPAADAGTNVAHQVVFDLARQVPFELPFGTCVFLDTTFLPGTVTMRLFEHEIELLPRVLIIDHQEHPWRSGLNITLTEEGRH